MTNGSNDRLDQIEDDWETVKEILFTVARRYETAADRMDATDERIERLAQGTDERLERLGQKTDERIERLGQKQERTQQQLDQLREDVDIAFQTISLMAEKADREMVEFRSAILGLQTENHRIWEYLMHRDQNSNGDQS